MPRIVFGAGTSHTPVLALAPANWEARSTADRANPALNLSDGRFLSYAELEREVGEVFAPQARLAVYEEKAAGAQRALDRLASDLQDAAVDIVVIIGDDQEELFSAANQPAFAIYCGNELVTNDHYGAEGNPEWMRQVAPGYAMDRCRSFPAAPGLALDVVRGLMDAGVDVSVSSNVVDPAKAGFGHAFGFVIQRLFNGRQIPVLPVLLNTYYPPNVPTSQRCYEIGQALRRSIESAAGNERVAVIASGGLSHFVVDEALDRQVLESLGGDHAILRRIPRCALNSGSSEILNWVMVAGAVGPRPLRWSDYYPIYRTPAGTGVGVGMAVWDMMGT